jgi:hypothetical protein
MKDTVIWSEIGYLKRFLLRLAGYRVYNFTYKGLFNGILSNMQHLGMDVQLMDDRDIKEIEWKKKRLPMFGIYTFIVFMLYAFPSGFYNGKYPLIALIMGIIFIGFALFGLHFMIKHYQMKNILSDYANVEKFGNILDALKIKDKEGEEQKGGDLANMVETLVENNNRLYPEIDEKVGKNNPYSLRNNVFNSRNNIYVGSMEEGHFFIQNWKGQPQPRYYVVPFDDMRRMNIQPKTNIPENYEIIIDKEIVNMEPPEIMKKEDEIVYKKKKKVMEDLLKRLDNYYEESQENIQQITMETINQCSKMGRTKKYI